MTRNLTVPCSSQPAWNIVFQLEKGDTGLTLGRSTTGKLQTDRQVALSKEGKQELLDYLLSDGPLFRSIKLHDSASLDVFCWRQTSFGDDDVKVRVVEQPETTYEQEKVFTIPRSEELVLFLKKKAVYPAMTSRPQSPVFGL